MIKFSNTIFALPFAGITFLQALPETGLIVAGKPTWGFFILVLQILICMVSLRSAAMGFNRLVDRKIDAANPRTEKREIPSGAVSIKSARMFIIVFSLVFVGTAFSINILCGLLSPLAMVLVYGYSYTKRFTFLCHYVLGLGIGIAPTAAWVAVRGEFALLPLIWSAVLMFYIAGFDILYSCQDADFDRENGLYSIPSRLGITPAIWIARISHITAVGLLIYAGFLGGTGLIYQIATLITAGLFVVEHTLVRPGKLDKIPIAFFNINASISTILFAGLLLDFFIKF